MIPISYEEYTTLKGDTFDLIALDFYDDEFMASKIIKENPFYSDVLVFEAGEILYIPMFEEETADVDSMPPWRR